MKHICCLVISPRLFITYKWNALTWKRFSILCYAKLLGTNKKCSYTYSKMKNLYWRGEGAFMILWVCGGGTIPNIGNYHAGLKAKSLYKLHFNNCLQLCRLFYYFMQGFLKLYSKFTCPCSIYRSLHSLWSQMHT